MDQALKFHDLFDCLHRIGAPAIENIYTGFKVYYHYGLRYCTDGPAIEGEYGNSCWYIEGHEYYSKEKWFAALTSDQKYEAMWNLDEIKISNI